MSQMNRILVIEGTTFKQLIEALKKDPLVQHDVSIYRQAELLKALDIPFLTILKAYSHQILISLPKVSRIKRFLKDLYSRQMKAFRSSLGEVCNRFAISR